MNNLLLKINTLTVIDIKQDRLIKKLCDIINFDDINKTLSAYADFCGLLYSSGNDLALYLHDAVLYTKLPLFELAAVSRDELISDALYSDFSIIKEIAETKNDAIYDYIKDKFKKEIPNVNAFNSGDFNYSLDYFIGIIREKGTGITSKYKAFKLYGDALEPIINLDKIKLSDLKEYEYQRNQVIFNTKSFLSGLKAQNLLLYGDRGTGKSSTVKALLNEYDNIRIIEIKKSQIPEIPELYLKLSHSPLKFILFLDDLTFEENDGDYHILKQCLEGSLAVKPDNIIIYATTNRRHLIKESTTDRDRDVFHRGDALDDNVSLADRFGIFITFSLPDKELYLTIVKQLAEKYKSELSENELVIGAERFALKKGGRSPRIARQYIDLLSAEMELEGSV